MARTTPVNTGYSIINGTTTGPNGGTTDTWIEWAVTDRSIVNNTSTVRAILYSSNTAGKTSNYTGTDKYGWVSYNNGTKQWLTISGYNYANYNINKFADHTWTIEHNADGTKTISLQGQFTTKSDWITGGSVNGNVTLPRIARASTISNATANLGSQATISITRQSSDFTHTISYKVGSASPITIATKTTATSVNFTPDVSLISQFGANSKTATGTITCETFSGNTSVGTSTSTLTLNIPNSSLGNVSGTFGSAVTLTANNACASGLTYSFAYNNGSSWQSIASTTSKTQSWTPNTNLIASVSNASSGSFSIRVITYRGETAINTATATATISIPKNTSSAVSGTIGSAVSIPITKAHSNLTTTIAYSFGSSGTTTIVTQTTSTNYSWTPPTSLLTQIPNSTSGTGSITITTYNGTASCGSNTYTLTLSAASSVVPTSSLTLEIVNNNPLANGWGLYVQGYSQVRATLTANGTNGSTISNMSINGLGLNATSSPKTSSGTLTRTSAVLTTSGSQTYTGNASDSRSRSATTKTQNINIHPYSAPSLTGISLARANSSGTIDTSGTYLKVVFTQNYSSVDGHNSATTSLKYRIRGASSWTSYGTVTNGANLNLNLDVSNNYEAQLLISDALNSNIASAIIIIPSAERIINVNPSGAGLAIGGFSTQADTLQVYYPTDFVDDVPTIGGNNFIREAKGYALMQKTQIPANANLNNYLTAGSYYTSSNSDASSMSNCPTEYAFNLMVDRTIGQTPAEASLTWRGVIQTIWDYFGNHYERYLFYDASTLRVENWRKVLSSTYDSSTNVATMIDSSRWYKGKFFTSQNYSYTTTDTSTQTGYKEFLKKVLDDWITMPSGYYVCGIGWSTVTWGTGIIAVDNNSNYCYVQWFGAYNIHLRGQLWNDTYSYRYDGEANWSDTYQGLTVNARRRGSTCDIYVSGTTTSAISTSGASVTLCTLPEIYRPLYGYVNLVYMQANLMGQLNITTAGAVNLGYTHTITTSANVNLASGTSIWARTTYAVQ